MAAKEKDKDTADLWLENIEEDVRELYVNFSGVQGERSIQIRQEASMVQDLLESAREGLGNVDIRTINEKDLVDTLNIFHREAVQFDQDVNNDAEKGVLKLMRKKMDKLFPLLELEWNSNLAVREGDWVFFRASPLKSKLKMECRVPECGKVYTEPRSYQNHLKTEHQIVEKVPKLKVTCRLHHKKQTGPIQWDQIATHLKVAHGIEKPTKKHFVRGFESHDGGRDFKVVWKEPHESDPTSPASKKKQDGPKSSKISTPLASLDVEPVLPTSTSASTASIGSAAGPSCSRNLFGESMPELVPEESDRVPLLGPFEPSQQSSSEPGLQRESQPMAQDIVAADPEEREPEAAADSEVEPEREKSKTAANSDVEPEKLKAAADQDVEPEKLKAAADPDVEPEPEKPKDLSDHFCKDDEFETAASDLSDDSDVEDDDCKSYTHLRLRNKKKRYQMRDSGEVGVDLSSLPGNKEFIEEFCQFLAKKGDSTNPQSSTIVKAKNHLFRHDDAWLPCMLKKRPDFKLEQLINFKDRAKFVALKDPQSWVESIGGDSGKENPSRQREFYKNHKQLRDFVIRKLNDADLGNEDTDISWEQKIRSNLQRITEDVNGRNTWAKLDTGIQNKKLELDQAKEVLSPRKNLNEANANSSYFTSQEYQTRADKNVRAWKRAMDNSSISESAFNEFMNFSRHVLVFTDRCRQGVYDFSNQDYFTRKKCWFPPAYKDGDYFEVTDEIFIEPEDKRAFEAYAIPLTGGGKKRKRKESATVTISLFVAEFLAKCRDLKDLVFGKLNPDDMFFSKYDKSEFGPIQNRKGSMLAEFGKVTGVDWCTATSLRRSLAPHIQRNPEMQTRSKAVAQHSAAVDSKYYDRSEGAARAGALYHILNKEVDSASLIDDSGVTPEIRAKRKKIEEEDNDAKVQKAMETVKRSTSKKVQLGKNCKVAPSDRQFLQDSLGKDGKYSDMLLSLRKFPAAAKFRKIFYRYVDSLSQDDGDEDHSKLLSIERNIFGVIKKDFEEDKGGWNGGELNKLADQKVAAAIHSSLKSYETNRKHFEPSYFNF